MESVEEGLMAKELEKLWNKLSFTKEEDEDIGSVWIELIVAETENWKLKTL